MNESLGFCGPEGFGPFSPDRVDFAPCFEETIIYMIPKASMIVFGIYRLFEISKKPSSSSLPVSFVAWSKNMLTFISFLLYLAELILTGIQDPASDGYMIFSAVFSLLATVVAGSLTFVENSRVKRTSPILTLFWTGMVIGGIFKLRTDSLSGNTEDIFFTLFCVQFALSIALTFLCSLRTDRNDYHPIGEEQTSPEQTSNIFSVLSFWWMTPLMVLGYKKTLASEDLWPLNPRDKAQTISEVFEENWKLELKKEKPSLLRALVKSFGGPFLIGAIFKLGQDICSFLQPVLLGLLIEFIESDDDVPIYRGYLIAAGMFCTALLQTILLHQYFHRCLTTGMRTRTGVATAVFRKSFKLSNDAKQKSTVGEMVNLMSIDAQRLMDICSYAHILWSGPFQIAVALYLLYGVLGPSVFTGLIAILSLFPLNAWVAGKMRNHQKIQMDAKDTRTKLMDEILSGIKVIKLYAWEIPFKERIQKIRDKELSALTSIAYGGAFQNFSWSCAPFLISVTSFLFFVIIEDSPLTPEIAFVSLSLFNLLQFPLTVFPSVVFALIQASVSLNRIHDYLVAEELDPDNVVTTSLIESAPAYSINNQETSANEPKIEIQNGTFSWSKSSQKPTLENISLVLHPGSLLGIVGSVGAGKSSLISAMLGEMVKLSGRVVLNGSVSYVPQQAWIMNATLKENIIFGFPFEEEFYQKVIDACALRSDLDILPAGDETEIGEKGINLSGGQKQRVSLARAVYSRSDICILDDPLSAVDAHVGKHIFDQVIGPKGLLKDKARIFVTHGIHYLPKSDFVIFLKEGKILEEGPYEELLQRGGEFGNLIAEFSKQKLEEEKEEKEEEKSKLIDEKEKGEKVSKIIVQETSEVGQVQFGVYKLYFGSMGIWPLFLLFMLLLFGSIASIGSNLWLSYWSSQDTTEDLGLYIGVYAALGIIFAIFTVLQALVAYVVCGLQGARRVHDNMLDTIMRAPMEFFDTTPLGRILNRFSKDQNTLDEVLPRTFYDFVSTLFDVIGIIFVISYSTIYFLIAAIPLGFLYLFIQRYYLASSRELKRLDSVTKSPIYAHFSETLNGVTTIKAYQQEIRFTIENEKRLNLNQSAYYPSISSNRWLATRLEFVGALVVLLAAVFAVVSYGKIAPEVVGLSVTYALSMTQTLNWMVRMSCDLEANVVSVERMKEYAELKTEAPAKIPNRTPPKGWPAEGVIQFANYSTRYRDGLDLVLRDISCSIASGEKIGVVGRTGAGKSSLTLALFRIIEAAAGYIQIDNYNIGNLGLFDLRSQLTIIPQDPVLFTGTIRDNLDPFSQSTDDQIWRALECAHLKTFIEGLEKKLESPVSQGGMNLSVGQRQLVCLARALLRKTKILILDEATAAVDVETDDLIQKTIREQFKECTIVTIAHRINTIMDNDRIMVLDKGRISEFDAPSILLKREDSVFLSLAKQSGLA